MDKEAVTLDGKAMSACGNDVCSCSTGIHGGLTFGRGDLDEFGYWSESCRICAEQRDKEMAAGRRDQLINEQVAHYRAQGQTAQEAALSVQRWHEWVYLPAWPYAEEGAAIQQSAP